MRMLALLLLLASLGATADVASEAAFRKLHEADWAWRLEQYPQLATSVGDHRFDDRLGSLAPEDIHRRYRYQLELKRELATIDRAALSPESRINYDIFEAQAEQAIATHETKAYLLRLNSDWGFHVGLARLASNHPLNSTQDYENYLARLAAVPRVMAENVALMQRGMQIGMVQPRVVLEGRDVSIRTHVVEDPRASVFFAPFRRLPAAVPEAERARLERHALTLIEDEVVPAYADFLAFFNGPYMNAARETLAAHALPDGERFYAAQIRQYTTLDLTPAAIHATGRREVARIRAEMQAIIDQLEFDGDFAAFLEFLRTDPQFYASSARELLTEASYFAKKMDGRLPALFGRLPRQPYGVEPVPDDLAPFFTGGRYVGASLDAPRGGLYWVNTYDLPNRPLYTLPALTLHEAAPGHHLQTALARERDDLPPFRRHDYISAYGEGWALYAEYLGVEADIYETPYQHFGRLTYEMWRACRLVVDTGLHAQGWTRDRAVTFMRENTALSLHEIETEIDRYISWPAQALSYKLGELKIRELRGRAEATLGPDFDLPAFHDRILALGSVPLSVLEDVMLRWIEDQRA